MIRAVWLAATGLVAAIVVLLGLQWSNNAAHVAVDRAARQTGASHLALLDSELQRFRLLPAVLGEYPDVGGALAGRADAARRLDRSLEALAAQTGAAAVYLVGGDGVTVAASNWQTPSSFVGQNYRLRPYFSEAMQRGRAEVFALGTVSRRPGLYLARRIGSAQGSTGVIVVKVEFDPIETAWRRQPGITLVTDRDGVVLITSQPDWRFRATRPLAAGLLAQARLTRQFGDAQPTRAPFELSDEETQTLTGLPARHRAWITPASLPGWRLVRIEPMTAALDDARTQLALLGLVVIVGLGGISMIATRTRRRRRQEQAARARLEQEVAARTTDLADANKRLRAESEERLETDRRYRAAREELAHVSRLGSLGQITAGVAHEINQPVAAIRAYAGNIPAFLKRNNVASVAGNANAIIELTDRIGRITEELRSFARLKTPAREAVEVGAVVDGTLLLIGDRKRELRLDCPHAARKFRVDGDRVRMEQILVNLLNNAFDAVAGRAENAVALSVRAAERMVEFEVVDNGPGIDPEIADRLFTPFASTKARGLGLGLAIARDLAREFGGDLIVRSSSAAGCAFLLTVPRR
ncbi:MAG: ATP-binding protein [Sphingomonadaceae bacterium]